MKLFVRFCFDNFFISSEYEAALVNGLCGAGGISRHPPQDKLEEFLPICGSLKVERVGQLIQEHLASSREKVASCFSIISTRVPKVSVTRK